ncbi:hypothetical protein JOQ06_005032 [Pogonophryne albipinna]|uniref:SEA domain-containing protein n=1 Tax=Pogonophryne albipinna TaxID=1090488 RepID=A0AAD6ARE4_9TELE|nr:hypothetical protein JOQ06_005032 [Pogonophryne albipinna]
MYQKYAKTTTAATTFMTSSRRTTSVTSDVTSTPAPTTALTTAATTKATPAVQQTTAPVKGFNLEMTVQLNKTFTDTLNDPQSAAYNDLKNTMNEVLINKYEGITGFIGVSVTGFREGSIFTDFVVETTEVKTAELAKANKEFSEAVNSNIAPVIGSVTALYNSEDELGFTAPIYTGNSMTLVCKPRNINKAILLDIGLYQCTLMGDVLQSPFKVNWFKDSPNPFDAGVTENGKQFCRTYKRPLGECGGSTSLELTCKVDNLEYRRVTTLNIFIESFTCKDAYYGDGRQGDKSIKECPTGQEGDKSAECDDGEWRLLEDTCVIKVIKELLVSSEELQVKDVPDFVEGLSKDVKEVKKEVRESPNTISTIVEILGNIADFPTLVVNQPVIESVLQTVDVIIGDDSRESWTVLNANENNNASSDLLGSMELLSDRIVGTFTFETDAILLNRSTFDDSFYLNLNSSVVLNISNTGFPNAAITTITFYTLNNVMPVRNTSLFNTNTNNTDPVNALNAAVVLIKVNETIQNVTLSYAKINTTLTQDPQRGVGDAAQRDERHTLVVILRCVAILTPLFGLTWSLGVGTMLDSRNRGLHIVFALFNSLQGFFILVFGTLFDSKIRSILARKSPTTSTGSNTTRSTSGGISSTGLNWFHRLHVYRVSETANSGSAGASESFSNI